MKQPASSEPPAALFDRVASILEQARGNVVRAVNTQMVLAYWLIGREIVQELQGGEERAEYGKRVLEELSNRLTEHYGKGFSVTNLKYFRLFYQACPERLGIRHPSGDESSGTAIPHPLGRKLETDQKPCAPGVESSETSITHPMGVQFAISYPLEFELLQAFSPQLTWSHYRALMRVDNIEARDFYECEAIEGGWDKRTLERQIQTFYYERMLKSAKPGKMLAEGRNLPIPASSPCEVLENPYVLEFLGLPDVADFHESDLERAIITHLQRFLLELGNGFAFVARQKQIRIGEQERYIDLTHADVGQMDGYVRMFDDLVVAPDDNPTIGLILCTEKNETVARYSVLKDRKLIDAAFTTRH